MVGHVDAIITAINGVAYNYHWDLEYIKTSFSQSEVKRLLDDALLFNPWVSSKKEHAPDKVPEEAREQLRQQREEWLQQQTLQTS